MEPIDLKKTGFTLSSEALRKSRSPSPEQRPPTEYKRILFTAIFTLFMALPVIATLGVLTLISIEGYNFFTVSYRPESPTRIEERENQRANENHQQAKAFVEHAAEMLKPFGSKPIGFIVSYLYKGQLIDQFFTVSQLSLVDVPESIALTGIKEASRKAMLSYGHKTPTPKRNEKIREFDS